MDLYPVFGNVAPSNVHGVDFVIFTRTIATLPVFQKAIILSRLDIVTLTLPSGDGSSMLNVQEVNLIKGELADNFPSFGNVRQIQPLVSISRTR